MMKNMAKHIIHQSFHFLHMYALKQAKLLYVVKPDNICSAIIIAKAIKIAVLE